MSIRKGKSTPQYQTLNDVVFQTLEVGEHLICADQPEDINGYIIQHVSKSANGVVMSVELTDDFDEERTITSDDNLSTWDIEF